MEKYTVIIPIALGDVPVLKQCIKFLCKNMEFQKIIIIGSNKVEGVISEDGMLSEQVQFLNEDRLVSYGEVSEYIEVITDGQEVAKKRTGWYLQQFLKMQYARVCQDEYYIVWDADTILLKSIQFFNNGKPVFDVKEEYHRPYFETMNRLIPDLNKTIECSFISEHMIISTKIMQELLDEIESSSKEGNTPFWKCILNVIDKEKLGQSGFSEFETFGNYCMIRHPNTYEMHHYKSFREGSRYFDIERIEQSASWIGKYFQAISFEKTMDASKLKGLFESKLVHKLISIRVLFAMVTRIRRIKKN